MSRIFAELKEPPRLIESSHPLLQGVEPAVIERLERAATLRCHKRGAVVLSGREASGAYCLLQRGSVRISSAAHRRQRVTLAVMQAPALLSGGSSGCETWDSAVALEPVLAWLIPDAALQAAAAASPQLSRNLWRDAAARLEVAAVRMRVMALHGAAERLQHVLVSCFEAFGLPVAEGRRLRVAVSVDDLAQEIGATRRSVERAMRQLRENGVLGPETQHLVLRDAQALGAGLPEWAVSLVYSAGSPGPFVEARSA